MASVKTVLDRTIGTCIAVGMYIIIWTILLEFDPDFASWSDLYWILFFPGVIGGTALYIRICYTIVDLFKRYVKVEKIDTGNP